MACRCLFLPGAPDLWIRLGWLQSSTRNGMKWGALALLEISHSRAATWSLLYCLYKGCVHQDDQIPKRPQALCPGGLYSCWLFTSPANGSGSCDCAPVTWAYGTPCSAMVSPNVGPRKEGKLLYPDHHLIRCTKSGFRPAHYNLKTLNLNNLLKSEPPPNSEWSC